MAGAEIFLCWTFRQEHTHTQILNSRLSRLYLTSVRQLLFESISPKPQRFRYGRDDGAFTRLLKKVSRYFKILCAPVFIFSRGSSALLVGHPRCGLSIWLSLFAIFNPLFWVYANVFHEKTDKTRKYSKSAIFVRYEKGRRRLQGAQSINTERATRYFAITVGPIVDLCLQVVRGRTNSFSTF